MSKRKGMSAEEKRIRLLELFYEKKEFFQLKELEKIAPKEKGIVSQSVKEILQGLVDDGFVDSDKIGLSIYFWAFPSKAKTEKKARLESTETNIDICKSKITQLMEELENRKEEDDDIEEKRTAMKKVTEMQQIKEQLIKDISQYSYCDPDYIKEAQEKVMNTKDAVNRWTENIFTMRSWCQNKISVEEEKLNKHFNIPENLDYMEI